MQRPASERPRERDLLDLFICVDSFSSSSEFSPMSKEEPHRPAAAARALPPCFRFRPTEEELVCYFLRRKVWRKRFLDVISEIDIYKSEPWDLPGLSRLKSKDLEWYFFSSLDKKYRNGSRANRSTKRGYWKTTGKDKTVQHNSRIVGVKRTLVFYIGRAPHGERTNWVMYEYRLEDTELSEAGVAQGAYVLCRVFQKSGAGPRNGEHHGAPFIEEDWNDDIILPQIAGDDGSGNANDLNYNLPSNHEQNLVTALTCRNAAPVITFERLGGSINSEDPVKFVEMVRANKFLNDMGDDPVQKKMCKEDWFFNIGENGISSQEHDEFFIKVDEPENNVDLDGSCLKFNHVSSLEMNGGVKDEAGCFSGKTLIVRDLDFDASTAYNRPLLEDGFFLQMDDLITSVVTNSEFEALEELLTYFAATDNHLHREASLPALKADYTVHVLNLSTEVEVETAETCPHPDVEVTDTCGVEGVSSLGKNILTSRDVSYGIEATDVTTSDVKNEDGWNKSLTKMFISLLESVPSSPAFAAEFSPIASISSYRKSSAKACNSVNIEAESSIRKNGIKYCPLQTRKVKFLDSYDNTRHGLQRSSAYLFPNSVCLQLLPEIPSRPTSLTLQNVSHVFFWILVLAASFKIGSYFY